MVGNERNDASCPHRGLILYAVYNAVQAVISRRSLDKRTLRVVIIIISNEYSLGVVLFVLSLLIHYRMRDNRTRIMHTRSSDVRAIGGNSWWR